VNKRIAVIWWGMLIATVAAVVPIAVTLLSRALEAAQRIERYTAEALEGGVKIAGNTANVAALKDTISVAPALLSAAGSLEQHTAAIASALTPSPPATKPGKGSGNGRAATEEIQP
jgi:hypothetical protein